MRILIIRPGAIGDCIVSLPAMEHLRADYTEVWVASQNVPLIRFADKVRGIISTGLDLVGITEPPMAELKQFDSIVSWYGTARPEFRDAVAGLPFEFHSALPSGEGHAVDFYLQQVGGKPGAMPRIRRRRKTAGFAAIHPFSGSPRKNWPLERFRAVCRSLPLPVQFCAGPEEPLENAVRISNLYDLGCWLSEAEFYIGNDSGISHLAAAVGTPVYAVFGPTDPAVWAPRGKCVQVIHRDPITDVSVEEVLEKLC
ncbi:MAG: glycosyltransferase family 9 protein [Bryobacteraceae bacterium]